MNILIAATDLNVFYHRSNPNSGKTPIVLLHGYTDNGSCWARVARELETHYDVIMPDARGHGRTEGSVQDFSYDLLGADLLAFIAGLGLERPFLFGHSMGALTALIAAAKAPQLLRGIILEDPPFWDNRRLNGIQTENLQAQAIASSAFQKRPLAERIAHCTTNNPGWSEEEISPWAASKGEYNPGIMLPANRLRMHTYPWRSVLARAACSALLITANPARGGIVTPKTAVTAAKQMPDCKVVQIRNAGHCIHRDAYKETMQAVTSFLAAH